jgi:hypothetical protein
MTVKSELRHSLFTGVTTFYDTIKIDTILVFNGSVNSGFMPVQY